MIGDFTNAARAVIERRMAEYATKCGEGISNERLYWETVGRRKGLKDAIDLINEEADRWLREQDER